MCNWTKFGLLIVATAAPLAVSADDQSSLSASDFDWGGFITQGWSLSSDNNAFGESSRNWGSLQSREIGLNASYYFLPSLRASGQLLSRTSGEVDNGEITADFLLLDWSFVQSADSQAGVRLGRIKNPVGFYNDTRDVAFTRPSAVLPQSIYLDRIREIALSSDGVGLYSRNTLGNGYLSLDLQYGRPQAAENTEISLLGREWDGQFDGQDMTLFRAMYENYSSSLRFAFTYADANLPFDAEATNPFPSGEIDFSLFGLSAQWNSEYWSFTTEFVLEKPDRKGFGGAFNPPDNTVQAYYMQLDRRINQQFSTFVRYDEVLVDKDDADGSDYQNRTGLPAHQRYAKDWTIGVAYQPNSQWLFRAEWHHILGTAWLSILDNPQPADTTERWNLAILQASYRF